MPRAAAESTKKRRADGQSAPASRRGEGFAVFVAGAGRAQRRSVDVGERGSGFAEIRSGLAPGERVIVHPSDQIDDGVRVREETAG